MKICFVIPPSKRRNKIPERVYGCAYSIYPQPDLPILCCAAALEQDGHNVVVRDFPNENNSWDFFESFVAREHFDAYIFHTVLLSENQDIFTAEVIRKYYSNIPIIFFGPQPTLTPERFLIDEKYYVVRGEAERVLSNLIKDLENRTGLDLKGISFLKNNKVIHRDTFGIIEDLNGLPFPARHHIDSLKHKYYNPKLKNRPVTLLLASRGCTYRCYFCVPNSISWAREIEWRRYHNNRKPPVRMRSAQNVIEEFVNIKRQGYKAVSIIDDIFLWGGKQRVMKICEGIADLGLEFGILARADQINDKDIIRSLADAGCCYVDLGIESLDKRMLEYIHKDLDPWTIKGSIELLNEYGIDPKLNIMFGVSPYETKKSILQTIEEICKLPVQYVMFSIATPFPGTEFYKVAKGEGWLVDSRFINLQENLDPAKKALISYPDLSCRDLEMLTRKANRLFYLRPKKILRQLGEIRSLRDIVNLIWSGLRVLK